MAETLHHYLFLFIIIVILGCDKTNGSRFSLEKDGKICLLMDAKFDIKINALVEGKTVASRTMDDSKPDQIKVNGRCGSSMSTLYLKFPNDLTWSLIFQVKQGIVTLDRLVQFKPDKVFTDKNITTVDTLVTFDDPGTTDLSPPDMSYFCEQQGKNVYNFNKTIPGPATFTTTGNLSDFRVQAFNLKNETFSPSTNCQSTSTSTTTTTTPTSTNTTDTTTTLKTTTTTTLPPKIPNSYFASHGDVICVALQGKLQLEINYKAKTTTGHRNVKRKFPVPSLADSKGNCLLSRTSQSLRIEFKDSWSLEFFFQTKENLTRKEITEQGRYNLDYGIHNVSVTFKMDHQDFPGSTFPDGHVVNATVLKGTTGFPHKAPGTSYYSCKTPESIRLNDMVKIRTSELAFKAFNENDYTGFDGYASECSVDSSDGTVKFAIILGFGVGGILFIVILLVAGFACKRRAQQREVEYREL